MSLSIQTNVASLDAQDFIRVNSDFQKNTIEQLSSGYRINSSADDAAGLAVANGLRADVAELSQGVQNSNNGINQLQIIDGGLNNVSQILDRLRTLATESASSTFTGDRNTLNTEFQSDLAEINRQASNINLNTGGTYNTVLNVYTGGGSNNSNSQVTIDLSGANNGVDATALGINKLSVAGGGTELSGDTVRLDDPAVSFLTNSSQTFTFQISNGNGNQQISAQITGQANGLTGTQVIDQLNSKLQAYGISASIASDGHVQFGGPTAFTVSTNATGVTGAVANTGNATNSATYNVDASGFHLFGAGDSETVSFQNAGGSVAVTLNSTNAQNLTSALSTLNGALNPLGIYAVQDASGNGVSFQSANVFSINDTAYAQTNGGQLFATSGSTGANGAGAIAVTAANPNASSTGNAQSAITALQQAVQNLGLVQGRVGAGENKLQYAINLAQSQITNYSAAESGIRDADVATEAANLTKAQVLQQASIAALAQANSAPQAVLSLLKG